MTQTSIRDAQMRKALHKPEQPGRCVRAASAWHPAVAGYSLFEILVIMAVMSLILALALPNLFSTVGAMQYRDNVSRLTGMLNVIRGEAVVFGENTYVAFDESCLLNEGTDRQVRLTDQWVIESVRGCVLYLDNGFCGEASIQINAPDGRTQIFQIGPPNCQLDASGNG